MVFYGVPLVLFLAFWFLKKERRKDFKPMLLTLLILTLFAFALRSAFQLHYNWVANTFQEWTYAIRMTNGIILGPIMCLIPIIWWLAVDRKSEQRLYGLKLSGVDYKTYAWMLLLMVPLIAAASTQKDFVQYYPKAARLFNENHPMTLPKLLAYELVYGIDFVYVEFFFRGFLVIAFSRFLGPVSIPFAALMYCTIHFGKPLGETISSWFGGMLLGILIYETRSIMGGILVHVGIAWLMEIGGGIARWWE